MKEVGKFKDECVGQLMLNFVGVRPKLYSFDYERIAYFDIDKDGNEEEVDKPTDTSETRIVVAKRTLQKVYQELWPRNYHSMSMNVVCQHYQQSVWISEG